MKYRSLNILGSCIFTLLSACSTTGPALPENTVIGELPPMMLPAYEVGQQRDFTNMLTGDSDYWKITNVAADGTVSATMKDGCKWYSSAAWFDGVGGWEDCGESNKWSASTNTAIGAGPSLWPLTDGASAKYKIKRINKAGEVNTHQRTCNVSATNIDTGIGPLDAYKVVCMDSNKESVNVRTWYFNPEHGEIVFTRWRPDGGIKAHHKYL